MSMHSAVRAPFFSVNCYLNLGHLFPRLPRVTPEPGLQFLQVGAKWLCHVLSRPPLKEHDLRLLRRALFSGRYWAVSRAKNGLSTKGLPFFWFFKFVCQYGGVGCRNDVPPLAGPDCGLHDPMSVGGWVAILNLVGKNLYKWQQAYLGRSKFRSRPMSRPLLNLNILYSRSRAVR
jgi:hypothetical protein